MIRFIVALCVFLLAAPARSQPSITLPSTVNGSPNSFITIPATTSGSVVKWVVVDTGLNLFPVQLLKDTKTAVVTGAVGSYRVFAYTADQTGPSDPAGTTVVIGTTPPGPGPPTPADPSLAVLQAAFSTEADPARLTQAMQLAALYRTAATVTVNDPTLTTVGAYFQAVVASIGATMPKTTLAATKAAIAGELSKVLPTSAGAPLDVATRSLIGANVLRMAVDLEALR